MGDTSTGDLAYSLVRKMIIPVDLLPGIENADTNVLRLNAAFADLASRGGGEVHCLSTGTFWLSDHLLVWGKTRFKRGPWTMLKKLPGLTNNVCIIRNARAAAIVAGAPRDVGIIIDGGLIDGNGVSYGTQNVGSDKTAGITGLQGEISMIGVNDLVVAESVVQNSMGFGVQIVGDDFLVDNFGFGEGTLVDGIHINAPSTRGTIRRVHGGCQDDMIALNAWDWTISAPTFGDITEIKIENLRATETTFARGACMVKLLSGTKNGQLCTVRGVDISDVSGPCRGFGAVAAIYDYDQNNPGSPAGVGMVADISMRNFKGVKLTNGAVMCLADQVARNWTIDGVAWDNTSAAGLAPLLRVGPKGSLDRFTARSVSNIASSSTGFDNFFDIRGTLGHLVIDDAALRGVNDGTNPTGSDSGLVTVNMDTGWLDRVTITRSRFRFMGSLLRIASNAKGGAMVAKISDTTAEDVKHPLLLQKAGATVTAHLSSFDGANLRNDLARLENGAAITVRESASAATFAAGAAPYVFGSGGGTARHVGTGIGVDASKTVLTPQAGDMVRNTNAALACGAGVLVSDGTSWKNTFSGATY